MNKALEKKVARKEYELDHRISKVIVFIIVSALYYTGMPIVLLFFVLIFGVNSVQWVVESILGHCHKNHGL